ncbi:MAG: carboxylesterase family protein [Ruminococcus sp.]
MPCLWFNRTYYKNDRSGWWRFPIPHRYWAQSEDCQNLNVWTPDLDSNAKKPVMVWFHGGGYTNGSSIEGIAYDGKNLSDFGDVVVVTVNHRLNVLGYLDVSEYGEDYQYSGNCGVADLVASLKWVKENIANFGGDPDNVTIFGQSGGGGKIISMLATPEAEGLFNQAIVQSGSERYIEKDTAKKITEKTLEILGITDNQIEQLKEVPYDTLDAAATEAMKQVGDELGTSLSWRPVLDEDYIQSNFQEWTNDIPVMVGSVFGEMNCWTALDPNETNKNSWTEEEVDEKLTEKYGDKAESCKRSILESLS